MEISEVDHNEILLEELFWEFDTDSKRSGMQRDTFKNKMRYYATTIYKAQERRIIEAHQNLVIPKIETRWIHRDTKNIYIVTSISNLDSTRLVKYPYMIEYRREIDNTLWSRRAIDWHKSYEPYEG